MRTRDVALVAQVRDLSGGEIIIRALDRLAPAERHDDRVRRRQQRRRLTQRSRVLGLQQRRRQRIHSVGDEHVLVTDRATDPGKSSLDKLDSLVRLAEPREIRSVVESRDLNSEMLRPINGLSKLHRRAARLRRADEVPLGLENAAASELDVRALGGRRAASAKPRLSLIQKRTGRGRSLRDLGLDPPCPKLADERIVRRPDGEETGLAQELARYADLA